MKLKLFFFALFITHFAISQDVQFTSQDISIDRYIDGTLLLPNKIEMPNLVIIIGGTGPTDRNGNQNFSKHYALKKLAEKLTNNGVATFRYDKRILKQIKKRKIDPKLSFDDFVTDAITTLNYFKTQNTYNKIYIVGHDQGSLISILTAKEGVDGLISIAGVGKSIDEVIIDQINLTSPGLVKDVKRITSILKKGKTTNDYPQPLSSIFNIETQPFIANWMQYNPQEEIKQLKLPILIINGSKDLEVSLDETNILKAAVPKAKVSIIDDMNHVLFIIKGDDLENSKSYRESFRTISSQLIEDILEFIKSNN